MQKYLDQLLPALDWLLQEPGSDFARWLTLGLSVLAGMLVLWLAGRGFRFAKNSPWLCLVVVLLAWAMAVAAVAATRVHLPGHILTWGLLALIGLVFSVVVICGLMQVSYWGAFIPWCASMAAMVGVILLAQASFQSVGTGQRQAGSIREHKIQLREFTGD